MSNDVTPPPSPSPQPTPAVLPPPSGVRVKNKRLTELIQRLRVLLAPGTFNPKFSFLALITVPLIVFGLHALFNSGMIIIKPLGEVVVPVGPDVPSQVVFAARLGECADKGEQMDGARGVFMPPMLTVWVRNFDGWLMDRAEGNEALLKDSGFTPATYRTYLSLRANKGRVQSAAQEAGFRKWLREIIVDPRLIGKPGVPEPASLEQMFADADVHSQTDKRPELAPVIVTPSMLTFQARLLEYVQQKPELLGNFKITETLSHNVETFTRFLAERGVRWEQKLRDDKLKFQSWLESSRRNLCLTIGGREFTSMKPDAKGHSTLAAGTLKGQTDDDTLNILLFRRLTPSSTEEEQWRDLVSTYGVDSKAAITVAMRTSDDNGKITSLKMATVVNGGTLEHDSVVALPLRPVLMRSIAWAALAGVLWLIILVSMQTGTLRASLPENDPVITDWTKSPWSASRVVFAWWLAICTGCYLFLWAMKAQMDVLSGSAPLLLGINGGTLLASSFVGGSAPAPHRSFLEDIVSEGGQAEISRLQLLVWNGVLGLVFIWQSLADWQMPTFDPYLTTLLGISSTAYVGYKVAAK
ncbi:hypothetical protein [Prosthecobacter sp.]|uniref:hypothetical protein n=1 Tax=Prosthecobacter sp. TaxID=1965333 RepID=UPI0037851A24